MPSISSCPFCQVQVAVPAGAGPSDEVRCPLCQAQFSLEEALDIALPELILVRPLTPLNLGLTAGADSPLLGGGLLAHGGGTLSGGLRQETLMGYSPSDFNGHGGGTATLDAPPAGTVDDGAGGYSLGAGAEGFSPPSGDSWPGGQDMNTALADLPAAGSSAGGLGDPVAMEGAAGIAATPRKKRKEANMFLELTKAIVGGAIGMFLAYMIMLWGCNKDIIGVRNKLPTWMVPTKMQRR